MKTIILVLLPLLSYGQIDLTPTYRDEWVLMNLPISNLKWTTHTQVISDPLTVCNHEWVYEHESLRISTCAVIHDDCGCPNAWPDRKQICKICGYHVRVYKTCEIVDDIKEETYEETVNKFK